MELLIREISRQLDDLSREFYERVLPPVDIYEEGGNLIVKVDLPGFKKERVQVRVRADNTLYIEATKDEEERPPGIRYTAQRPRRIRRQTTSEGR